MEYTKNEIQKLINVLKRYDTTYEVLIDFFNHHLQNGHFDFGLSNTGTQSSAVVIHDMKNMFPDVWYALFMSEDQLPLFVSDTPENKQEYPIACWRLEIGK